MLLYSLDQMWTLAVVVVYLLITMLMHRESSWNSKNTWKTLIISSASTIMALIDTSFTIMGLTFKALVEIPCIWLGYKIQASFQVHILLALSVKNYKVKSMLSRKSRYHF